MADIGTNGGKRKLGLKKSQILRGFDTYKKVLDNSRLHSTDLLLAYLNKQNLSGTDVSPAKDKVESPLPTQGMIQKIKVGFIISKKKIRKAVMRNYGKRLMKEAFRLNQAFFDEKVSSGNINIIFALSANGLEKLKTRSINFEDLKDEMRILLEKIIK